MTTSNPKLSSRPRGSLRVPWLSLPHVSGACTLVGAYRLQQEARDRSVVVELMASWAVHTPRRVVLRGSMLLGGSPMLRVPKVEVLDVHGVMLWPAAGTARMDLTADGAGLTLSVVRSRWQVAFERTLSHWSGTLSAPPEPPSEVRLRFDAKLALWPLLRSLGCQR